MRDLDIDAISEKDIFQEAKERLRLCEDVEGNNRLDAVEALTFEDGEQWDDDIRNDRRLNGRPALTINHTSTVVNRLINTLRQQRPRIKCHPVGDGADIETARVVNGLIRHIETNSNASVAYDTGGASAVKIGWGYWRIVADYVDATSFDQELKVLPVRNTFSVYMDPASVMPAGEDQGWCIISARMKRNDYKRRYPNAENRDWIDGISDYSIDWESREEIRLAEYFRIHEVKDTLIQMQDGSSSYKSELPDDDLAAAVNYFPARTADGKFITRPTTRRVVQWFRLNGDKVVERRTLPGHYIPVIRCEGNVLDLNGQVKRKGMVKNLMDPARMTNYWRSAETERYALSPKAPWVAYEDVIEGHPEWHDANQRPYSVLVAKAVAASDGSGVLPLPERTPPAPVEAGMAQAAAGAYQDFLSVAGMPQESPEIANRVVSGDKHMQRRMGLQDLTHYQYYDNQTLAIMWTGIILLDLIPSYYDTRRMQRIIGDDGVPEMVEINAPQADEEAGIERVKYDMTVGKYDVVMDTGPGYQTKREEAAADMIQLMATPLGEVIVKTGADIVLRNLDFAGASDLADRALVTNPEGMKKATAGLPKQAQTIIGALMMQSQQKDQVIKELQLEIKYKSEIETGKLAQKDDQSKRELEVKVFDIESRDTTKRDVAEISAATQLLNTSAESAHEEKQADKLIKKGLD